MTKLVPIGIAAAVVAAGVGAFVLFKRPITQEARSAKLAPAGTLFYAQLPDLRESSQRWEKTALHQLWNEPEMQAFMERPRAKLPFFTHAQVITERLQRVQPREGFIAVTSIDGPMPQLVGGFSFSGNQKEAEAFVAEWRAELQKTRPAGKTDLVSYNGRDIQTFTDKDLTVAESFHQGWYLAANSVQLLQQTIDRHDGKGAEGGSLGENQKFRDAVEQLPADPDGVIYAELTTFTSRILDLLTASGQKPDQEQIDAIRKVQAIAACTKLDGRNFRDTIFLLSPGTAKQQPLPRNTMALTSPATLLYYVTALPEKMEISPTTMMALSLVAPGVGAVQSALGQQGLQINDLGAALGPEMSAVMEWPKTALQPSFVVNFDVRDPAKARSFAEVLTSGKAGTPAWTVEKQHGASVYSLPPQGALALSSPTLALSDRFATFGFSKEAVTSALGHAAGSGEKITASTGYQAASKLVQEPTAGFSYIDLQGLLERSYGTLRPLLVMSLAFMPEAGEYIDAAKLPTTETITKHLGPLAYSQSVSEKGTRIETAGPLTSNQVLLGIVAGAAGFVGPAMKQFLPEDGSLDPNKLLQLTPGGKAAPNSPAPPTTASQPPATADPAPAPGDSPEPSLEAPAPAPEPPVPAPVSPAPPVPSAAEEQPSTPQQENPAPNAPETPQPSQPSEDATPAELESA